MLDTETLFLRTLADIENRLGESDPYEILLIAGLVRKLFLDDFPLVDQVNRSHREKLTFEVTVPVNMPVGESLPTFWTVQDGLDPDTAPPFKKRHSCTRNQFFQTVVTVINSHTYTVRDVVLFEANVVGAVHAGAPKTIKDEALKQVDGSISVGGYGSALRQLLAIARVVLKALAPLRNAVAKA